MEISELVLKVASAARQAGVRYFITGSVASSVWGEPRSTLDLDVVVELDLGTVDRFCSAFGAEYYLDAEAARKAVGRRGMFNVIVPEWGLKIDVIVASPGEQVRFARAQEVPLGEPDRAEEKAMFSAPEDCIVSKLEFFQASGSESM